MEVAKSEVLSKDKTSGAVYRKSLPLLCITILILASIYGRIDGDIVDVFRSILNGSTDLVPPKRQFLFESILPNYIGAALLAIAGKIEAVNIGWPLIGGAILGYVVFLLWFRRIIDGKTIFLIVFFSPILKICVTWVGKVDPYLLAFLFPAVFLQSNPAIVFFSSMLAALCHPQIAVLSLVLLECARFMVGERPRLSSVGGALAGSLVAKAILYISGFAGASGRLEYIEKFLPDLILSGAVNSVSFIIMSIAPSILLFVASGTITPATYKQLSKVNVLPFAICLCAITIFCIFFTFDRSRVFTLLTFPAYAFLLHTYREQLVAFFLTRTAIGYLIALLMLASPQLTARDWVVSRSFEKVFIEQLGSPAMKRHLLCRTNCNRNLLE